MTGEGEVRVPSLERVCFRTGSQRLTQKIETELLLLPRDSYYEYSYCELKYGLLRDKERDYRQTQPAVQLFTRRHVVPTQPYRKMNSLFFFVLRE